MDVINKTRVERNIEHGVHPGSGRAWSQITGMMTCGFLLIAMCLGRIDVSLADGCVDQVKTSEEWMRCCRKQEGFYANQDFGYAVTIPPGLVGWKGDPGMPQHGIAIPLSTNPPAEIHVAGDHNVFDEWISNEAMAETYLRWMTEDAQHILSVEHVPVTLDGHPAIRLIVHIQCPDGTFKVHDLFLTLYGVAYSLHLMTDITRYDDDKRLLEHIAASWLFSGQWWELVCGNAYPFSSPEKWKSRTQRGWYTGTYTNQKHGYTVTVPAGFVGKSEYPTYPAYGIGILLSREGYLLVDGRCNWPIDTSLEQTVETIVKWITANVQTLNAVEKQSTTLGNVPAIRLTVRYECPVGTPMVKDLFLALHGDNVYKVDLIATAAKYREYQAILEQFADTFRLTGEPTESCR